MERLKKVIEQVISPSQNGFVPGRRIEWGTHLLHLIDAYLDETDQEGRMIFLDWEKAFDRCSWEYLHQAADAIGLGTYMCDWLGMLYDHQNPAKRRVSVNGHMTSYFELQCGTAQGAPASPIVFLLIAEGLSRLISDEPDEPEVPPWSGIVVSGKEHRLSQFADDTVLFLSGFKGLKSMWRDIKIYEEATGGKANVSKFEGIRCGASRHARFDRDFTDTIRAGPWLEVSSGNVRLTIGVPKGMGIRWCRKGEYVTSLGVPHGWDFRVNDWFWAKYRKSKAIMSGWHDVERMSPHGSAMLANSMVYGRYRYWLSTLVMPRDVMDAIGADVQALVWGKDVVFDAEEAGSQEVKRFVKERAQYQPRRKLGTGLVHWPSHCKAMAAIIMFQYNEAGEPPYKSILDLWLGRYQEGRGAVFSTIQVKSLVKPLGQGASKLPAIFRFALRSLRELTMEPVGPGYISQDEARAEPPWNSPVSYTHLTLPTNREV